MWTYFVCRQKEKKTNEIESSDLNKKRTIKIKTRTRGTFLLEGSDAANNIIRGCLRVHAWRSISIRVYISAGHVYLCVRSNKIKCLYIYNVCLTNGYKRAYIPLEGRVNRPGGCLWSFQQIPGCCTAPCLQNYI